MECIDGRLSEDSRRCTSFPHSRLHLFKTFTSSDDLWLPQILIVSPVSAPYAAAAAARAVPPQRGIRGPDRKVKLLVERHHRTPSHLRRHRGVRRPGGPAAPRLPLASLHG